MAPLFDAQEPIQVSDCGNCHTDAAAAAYNRCQREAASHSFNRIATVVVAEECRTMTEKRVDAAIRFRCGPGGQISG